MFKRFNGQVCLYKYSERASASKRFGKKPKSNNRNQKFEIELAEYVNSLELQNETTF